MSYGKKAGDSKGGGFDIPLSKLKDTSTDVQMVYRKDSLKHNSIRFVHTL